MKLNLVVYYSDGTSRTITIDKPAGYHPESTYVGFYTAQCAVQGAYAGKTCVRVARQTVLENKGKPCIVDEVIWEGRYP